MAWQAIASLGLGAANQYSQGNLDYDQAKMSIKSINKMLENMNKQKEELASAYSTRKKIATDIYGNKVEDAYYKANRSLKDINRRYDSGTSQSGLAYSGTLYEASREGTQGVRHELTSTKRDLENQLGQTLADIMVAETKDMATIENTMQQLEGQKEVLGKTRTGFMEFFDPGGLFGSEMDTDEWGVLFGELGAASQVVNRNLGYEGTTTKVFGT